VSKEAAEVWFAMVPVRAFSDSRMKFRTLRVLCAICMRRNKSTGRARVSADGIAKGAGINDATAIWREVARLIEWGYLRKHRGRRRVDANEYEII
jgi:hypothetical protein